MNTEAVIYLFRKTSLTRTEIGKLSPDQLNAIVKEVSFQESIEEYHKAHAIASLLAAIYNTIPRKRGSKVFKASDFLQGEAPTRNKPQNELEQLASKHNIKLPTKEIKNRGE